MTNRKYLRWQNVKIKFTEWNRWHFQVALLFSGRKYWDEKQESWHSEGLFYLIGRACDIEMGRFQRQKQFCYPTNFKEMLKCILWLSRKLLTCGMIKLTGAVLLSGKSTLVQNFGLLVCAKNRKLLKPTMMKMDDEYNWWSAKSGKVQAGDIEWIWAALKLSRTSILISTELNSEKFPPLNPITRIKFWQCQIRALTQKIKITRIKYWQYQL